MLLRHNFSKQCIVLHEFHLDTADPLFFKNVRERSCIVVKLKRVKIRNFSNQQPFYRRWNTLPSTFICRNTLIVLLSTTWLSMISNSDALGHLYSACKIKKICKARNYSSAVQTRAMLRINWLMSQIRRLTFRLSVSALSKAWSLKKFGSWKSVRYQWIWNLCPYWKMPRRQLSIPPF